VLGDTVEQIARDKAGIAKPGVPLVTDASGCALDVIATACKSAGAPLICVSDRMTVETRASQPYGQAFLIRGPLATYDVELPVLGTFQRRNAATALTALEVGPAELRPTAMQVQRAFESLVIPGRMEFFPGYPGVVFDIAHNPDKARSLAESLRTEFPRRRFTFVVAIGDSKDAPGVLESLLPLPGDYIFTTFDAAGRNATRPQRLAHVVDSAGRRARVIADPVEALSVARRAGDVSTVVVVTGSTFLVATLRAWWCSNVVQAAAQ